MSEVRSRIPFDTSSGNYRASWQQTQDDQVSLGPLRHLAFGFGIQLERAVGLPLSLFRLGCLR